MNRDKIILLFCTIAAGCGITVALSMQEQNTVHSSLSSGAPPIVQPTQPITPASPRPPIHALSPHPMRTTFSPVTQEYQMIQIDTCGGQLGHANFRQFPSLAPASILGVVPHGGYVALTGRMTIADEVQWHEAINPNPLLFHPASKAQNQLGANQVGWIASCFVK